MEWRLDPRAEAKAKVLHLGPWPVGRVFYESLAGKKPYGAMVKLPGLKSLINRFSSEMGAMIAVEKAVEEWLSAIPPEELK